MTTCIGNLALSRAFGDFGYKQNKSLAAEDQIITCDPEIVEHKITEDDEFVVIACDGLCLFFYDDIVVTDAVLV